MHDNWVPSEAAGPEASLGASCLGVLCACARLCLCRCLQVSRPGHAQGQAAPACVSLGHHPQQGPQAGWLSHACAPQAWPPAAGRPCPIRALQRFLICDQDLTQARDSPAQCPPVLMPCWWFCGSGTGPGLPHRATAPSCGPAGLWARRSDSEQTTGASSQILSLQL